jgi:hypothetical protein
LKYTAFVILSLLIVQINFALAQTADSAQIKKTGINNIFLCQNTVSGLKQLDKNLQQVDVEEMDLAKGCYGGDSRFIAGSGYATNRQPGLIFQKDQHSDYISKIRITKQFKGMLPDGKFLDMQDFRLRDLFRLYPKYKSKWGSRGCSEYWNFSNDTISFYVKIDKAKQPQFPVDEAYYLDKPVVAADMILSCYGVPAEDSHTQIIDAGKDPVYFIDSIRVTGAALSKYDPSDIAMVTVYKDSSAVGRLGPAAKNGLIYIETKKFSKQRYWRYFSSKSEQYAKLVPSAGKDSGVQYILNKKILKENFEGDLAAIDDKVFQQLEIISKDKLIKDYGIRDKQYGVIITSTVPADLHNGKSKFNN